MSVNLNVLLPFLNLVFSVYILLFLVVISVLIFVYICKYIYFYVSKKINVTCIYYIYKNFVPVMNKIITLNKWEPFILINILILETASLGSCWTALVCVKALSVSVSNQWSLFWFPGSTLIPVFSQLTIF